MYETAQADILIGFTSQPEKGSFGRAHVAAGFEWADAVDREGVTGDDWFSAPRNDTRMIWEAFANGDLDSGFDVLSIAADGH